MKRKVRVKSTVIVTLLNGTGEKGDRRAELGRMYTVSSLNGLLNRSEYFLLGKDRIPITPYSPI